MEWTRRPPGYLVWRALNRSRCWGQSCAAAILQQQIKTSVSVLEGPDPQRPPQLGLPITASQGRGGTAGPGGSSVLPNPVLVTLDFTARIRSVLRARPTCCDLCRPAGLPWPFLDHPHFLSSVPGIAGALNRRRLLFPESLTLGWDPGPFFQQDLCSPLASWEQPAAHERTGLHRARCSSQTHRRQQSGCL